jgi:1-phosphofructokinase family hexose kinase
MILTVTANPAIDKVYDVDELRSGAVIRSSRCETFAAGKGINLARGLRDLGREVLALGFAGGHSGQALRALLAAERIPEAMTVTRGEVRLNPTIRSKVPPAEFHVVEPAAGVTRDDVAALLTACSNHLPGADVVAVAGTLPPGLVASDLLTLIQRAHQHGVKVAVDTSGPLLRTAIEARPWLMKPNAEELSELMEENVLSGPGIVAAARRLVDRGAETVAVSQAAEAAYLVRRAGAWMAVPPTVDVVNSVGCGDAMMAGLIHAFLLGRTDADVIRYGVAAGTANVLCHVPGRIPPEHLEELLAQVRVTRVG